MKYFSLMAAGVLIVTSCISTKKSSTSSLSFYDTKWSLKKIHTDTTLEVVSSKAFIRFNEAKKSGGGSGGCNGFGSTITVKGDYLTISELFSTKMYCEGIQQTEDAFFRQLSRVNRYEIRGNILLLYFNKELLLELEGEN
jgi:heat shock protein HslJ